MLMRFGLLAVGYLTHEQVTAGLIETTAAERLTFCVYITDVIPHVLYGFFVHTLRRRGVIVSGLALGRSLWCCSCTGAFHPFRCTGQPPTRIEEQSLEAEEVHCCVGVTIGAKSWYA